MEILLMCALLCSTDVIAAISIVSYDEQPKLYSLLFGEGVVNDAVSIILFNSVLKFQKETKLSAKTLLVICSDFLMLSVKSLSLGVIFGLTVTILLKHARVLTRDATSECILLFCTGYMCYVTAETLK